MIERLLLFGASGDLTGRYLLPALAALHAHGRLPDGFEVLGAATSDWDDDAFRRFAAEHLEEHAPDLETSARDALVGRLRYRSVDVGDADSVGRVLESLLSTGPGAPIAAYLALPQGTFAPAVTNLANVGLPDGSRVALEKPFGEDRQSARQLNGLLHDVLGDRAEEIVFRVDHVLGMETVENLIALRHAERVANSFWSAEHIAEVEVLWEETLALEGRAGFYDRAGALKDVIQNHMLQLLSVVAMEPPDAGSRDLRDAKVDALRAVRSLGSEDVERKTQRARYAAGGDVPAYVDEEGVDPARCTETFGELLLEIESPRWSGTRFRLRAGKALARSRKGVVLHFRGGDDLWIGIDGPEDMSLRLAPLMLNSEPYRSGLPAYAHVLLDVLSGGSGRSVRDDEAEEAWRIVDPVLEAWRDDRVPMLDYPAGSDGPAHV